MDQIRLRAHHLEYLILRSIADRDNPRIKQAVDEHLANIYDSQYVHALIDFENKIKPDTLIQIVQGADDICEKLDCTYAEECLIGDFQALTQKMMKNVPEFLLALPIILSRVLSKESLEKQDQSILNECGIAVGETHSYAHLTKIYEEKSTVGKCFKCASLQA